MKKILSWIVGGGIVLVLLLVAMIIMIDGDSDDAFSAAPKAGCYELREQFGLRGLDWEADSLTLERAEAITPNQIYRLPRNTFWMDGISGDTITCAIADKIWYDMSSGSGGRYRAITRPLNCNMATLSSMTLELDSLLKTGNLGVSVPASQHDYVDGDSIVTKAFLFVVTKK